MFRYTAERVIPRPTAEVFDYLADVSRQPEWVHGVSSCRWRDGSGPGDGAVADQTMTFLGRRRDVPMTMTAFQPQRRVAYSKADPFPIRFAFEVEPEAGGTRVRYPVEMEPRGLLRLLLPLIGRRTIEGDLDRIADHVQTRSTTG
jgi:uncharacterized protein YndB with AHSA1/START domain